MKVNFYPADHFVNDNTLMSAWIYDVTFGNLASQIDVTESSLRVLTIVNFFYLQSRSKYIESFAHFPVFLKFEVRARKLILGCRLNVTGYFKLGAV